MSGFWLCQKSKNPSRSFSSARGTIQTKMDLEHWKQCRRTFWTEEREGLWLPNRWTLAANKEVYEATNQPQCYFFWWVPLSKLPSRLLKEACLTGTLAFQVENEQKVSEIKSERKSSFYANFHHCLYLLLMKFTDFTECLVSYRTVRKFE